jgi:argininosuccinate lyase
MPASACTPARSRNDQVATDVRLWLRDEIDLIDGLLTDLQRALVALAAQNADVILPGFTHLQVAQPVSFRRTTCWPMWRCSRATPSAWRMCAGASTACRWVPPRWPAPPTRWTANAWRHAGHGGAGLPEQPGRRQRPRLRHRIHRRRQPGMVHISRFSEELVLWMSQNFGFIDIADRFCTGSSIMPQKKNPDVPELARGKTGRVVGHLMGLITLMKGQPLAYNKDNQEDKEPLFDTVDTLKDTLRIFAEMVGGQLNPATGRKEGGITVNPVAMEDAAKKGYATATDLADYLVKKGLPFRDAHETVAHAVKAAQSHACDLSELPLAVLQSFNASIEKDVYDCLSLRGSLNARNTLGGTAPAQVQAQIQRHRVRLG